MNVDIPPELILETEQKGFYLKKVKEYEFGGSTIITIKPILEYPVRLSAWKNIWNYIAEKFPKAKHEDLDNTRESLQPIKFRKFQDELNS